MDNNIQPPADYPVKIEIQYPAKNSRFLALLGITMFLKWVALAPHLIVIGLLGIAGCVASWFAFWAILFTKRYPRSLFDFMTGLVRWQTRINTWFYSLTDEYPPFSLR